MANRPQGRPGTDPAANHNASHDGVRQPQHGPAGHHSGAASPADQASDPLDTSVDLRGEALDRAKGKVDRGQRDRSR